MAVNGYWNGAQSAFKEGMSKSLEKAESKIPITR